MAPGQHVLERGHARENPRRLESADQAEAAIWPGDRRLSEVAVEMDLARVGGKRLVIRLNSVVLPAPFGPISAVRLPSGTSSVTSEIAARPPKRLLTLTTCSAGAHRLPPSTWRDRAPERTTARPKPRYPAGQRTVDARRQILEGKDQQRAFGKPLVERERLEDLRQQRQQRDAEQGPDQRALAADHQHGDHLERARGADHLGRQEVEVEGVEAARQRASAALIANAAIL